MYRNVQNNTGGGKAMSKQIWLTQLMGMALALALCSWATPARAGERDDDSGGSGGVPELDPRAAGLALTILGGSLFVLRGRRKRGDRVAKI
jgi:hypothetical protein